MEPIFPANPEERVGFYGGRIAEGLWGEPLNVAADVCLVIYILFYVIRLRREGFSDTAVYLLVLLGGLVGLGSIIFHSRPTRVTLQIDIIPILVFTLAYFFFIVRRCFNQSVVISAIYSLLFLLCSSGFKMAVGKLTVTGIHYLPAILVLILSGTALIRYRRAPHTGKKFLIAAGFFVSALFFRVLDLIVFRSFPLGTHFLWHACTSGVIIVLLFSAVRHKEIEGIAQRPVVP